MTQWTNSAEGGTNGTTITAGSGGNTGGSSGDYFDTLNIGSGHTITFDNTQTAHGGLSYKHAASGTSTGGYHAWTTAHLGTLTQFYWRLYVYLTAYPTAAMRFITLLDTTNASVRGSVFIGTTGFVTVGNSGGGSACVSTSAANLNGWTRYEGIFTGSATAAIGSIDIRTYLNPDSATASSTVASTTSQNTGGTVGAIRWGNNTPVVSQTYWLDDLGVSDVGYLGSPVASNTVWSYGYAITVGG